jgi:L-iditol 2-dehydrogenase
MRAMFVHGPRDLRPGDMPKPVPGPGEVLVRIKAVGICGSDVHNYVFGEIGGALITEPLVIGHEAAGIIEALGPGVHGLTVGMRVAVDPSLSCGHCELCVEGDPHICRDNRFFGVAPTHGAFREYIAHPADAVFPLPAGMTMDEGALLEPMGIGMYVAQLADVRLGDRVGILGCGPIGLMTGQMIRLSGAGEIIGTDKVEARLATARRLAMDTTFDANDPQVVKRIWEHTKGRGLDVVIDCAGANETSEQAMELARPGGTVVLVGIPPEDKIEFKASVPRRKGLTVKFDRRMKHTYQRCIQFVEAGRVDIKPLATHHFPLERLVEAMELVISRGDGVLKTMIEI